MHKSISSRELKPILSRLPEINSIFQLNTQYIIEREGLRTIEHNQLY